MNVRIVWINLESPEAEDLADHASEVRAQQEEGGRKLKGYCTMGCGNLEMWQNAGMNLFQVKPRASV